MIYYFIYADIEGDGNSVVPQAVAEIGRAILDAEAQS